MKNCREWEDLLQSHLDGASDEALRRHLLGCPHCASRRAVVAGFVEGVSRLTPPIPPQGLSDQIQNAIHADARQRASARWRLRVAGFVAPAAAAALLIAVGLYLWKPTPPEPPFVENKTPPAPLRESVARAGEAVATLTRNTAKDTEKQASTFLPVLKESAAPLTQTPPPMEPRLEEPLRQAADGASNGLAPVTDSARRAVSLFFRDLPGGRGEANSE